MQNPFHTQGTIAKSGSSRESPSIPLIRTRTLSITTRTTNGAAIDANATLYLYYSPDGNNWDTVAYASANIAYSAGAAVQRTVNIDTPEHGFMKVKLTNGSSADVLKATKFWYSIAAYADLPSIKQRGDIRVDAGEERGL